MPNISPFAPAQFPDIANIKGLRLTALRSGERYKGRNDMLIGVMDEGGCSAAVFTQSVTPGAPVIWSREVHRKGEGRAMIVTAGNANVCTGEQGLKNAQKMATATAKIADIRADQVFVCSTGVIGEQLKVRRILNSLPTRLDTENKLQQWQAASAAIMTTDTYPKAASASFDLDGITINISGIAKGSGMIQPDMATMLSYIFTDAAIEQDILQRMLEKAVDTTFNSITVDSDTSTSDSCLLFATAAANQVPIADIDTPAGRQFFAALEGVMKDLAQQVVRDGEGAQKFISVRVRGAETNASAKIIARSIANSPLVKTAIAGEDANWGRIVMAVGKAGQAINFERLATSVGGIVIAEGNGPLVGYDEQAVQAHIEGREVLIEVDVGLGKEGNAEIWTCDLTHGYIDINADYRS